LGAWAIDLRDETGDTWERVGVAVGSHERAALAAWASRYDQVGRVPRHVRLEGGMMYALRRGPVGEILLSRVG